MLVESLYCPSRWLRNAHVQSFLGSSRLRKALGQKLLHATGAVTTEHTLEVGDGIRLRGVHSTCPAAPRRGLVVLFHGWEGSCESSYMRFTAAQLLMDGFDVFRLSFRDHGDTHHLNEGLFLFSGLTEVVRAVGEISRLFPDLPLFVAGYSLGGNFALRVALAAPANDIPVRHVLAICPLVDPAVGLDSLERSLPIYSWYFMRKWRASLRKKRALFPDQHIYDDTTLAGDMRAVTRDVILPCTEYATVEEFFDDYSIADGRLLRLQVPVSILAAADDPVIPADGFRQLRLPAHSRLQISAWGGHCGFILDGTLRGLAERWISERLLEVTSTPRAYLAASTA